MLLAKTKLDTVELLISKALIDLYISCDECSSANNVWRKYDEMKWKIDIPENAIEYTM